MSHFRNDRPAPRFDQVRYGVDRGVATIMFDRPASFNAYSTRTLEEAALAFREASWDDAVHAVVLTGAGTRAFCTGGDVREYAAEYLSRPRDYWKYMGLFRAYIESILHCPKPVIARINGICVGGGNETQLACDLTVMAGHAYLGQVGTGVGSVPCGGATQWLPLVVGDKRARQMLYLNDRIPARQALEWGLVNAVAPSVRNAGGFVDDPTPEQVEKAQKAADGWSIDLARLDQAVLDLTDRLRDKFPECLRYTKAQANFWKELAWHQTVGHAQEWLALHYVCREPHEGMNAFVGKRPVDFAGVRRAWAEDRGPEFVWGAPTGKCPACGSAGLPAEFTHCGRCGAAMAAESAPTRARPEEAR